MNQQKKFFNNLNERKVNTSKLKARICLETKKCSEIIFVLRDFKQNVTFADARLNQYLKQHIFGVLQK